MLTWLRNRRARRAEERWQRIYNGHEIYVSREEPNQPVELTCRLCGYRTTNLDTMFDKPPYRPWPIQEPCPYGPDGALRISGL